MDNAPGNVVFAQIDIVSIKVGISLRWNFLNVTEYSDGIYLH